MKKLVALAVALLIPCTAGAAPREKEEKKVAPVLNFTMKGLDGKSVDLSQFQGKVVLIVNVASRCGATPQYAELQKLYETHAKDGLVVLGVPANEFGRQEPGTDKDIAEFCTSKYGVTFPMLSKVVVKGKGQVRLYKYLTSKETDPKFAGDIKWNFTKFLISKDGKTVKRYAPTDKPEDLVKDVEKLLKA